MILPFSSLEKMSEIGNKKMFMMGGGGMKNGTLNGYVLFKTPFIRNIKPSAPRANILFNICGK